MKETLEPPRRFSMVAETYDVQSCSVWFTEEEELSILLF